MRAYRVFLLRRGVSAFTHSMIYTILAVYYVRTVGMNPLQLVLVGTALEVSAFIFEIPTGVVADSYSRKWSVITGQALRGLCFVLQGLLPLFPIILLAEFVDGLGWTFISGAEDAWIADEMGTDNIGRIQLRSSQVSTFTGLIGMWVGVIIGSGGLGLPVFIGGVMMILMSVYLALFMPETGFSPAPKGEHSTWQHLSGTFTSGAKMVRGNTILLLIIAISFVYGGFSEGLDRLWEAHFIKDIGFPALGSSGSVVIGPLALDTVLVWFALIGTGSTIIGLGVTEWLRRRLDTTNQRRVSYVLLVSTLALVGAVMGFGLAGSFLVALFAFWLTDAMRAIEGPLTTTWLTQHTESRTRATVLSMHSQANAFGQMTAGPVVGGIANVVGMPIAIAISGLILSPAVFLYTRTFGRGKGAEPIVEEVQAELA